MKYNIYFLIIQRQILPIQYLQKHIDRIMNGGLNKPTVDSEDGSLSPEMQEGKVFIDTIHWDTYVGHVQCCIVTLCLYLD